eukprot:365159-Chlamydomonas_euryale.AAC.25
MPGRPGLSVCGTSAGRRQAPFAHGSYVGLAFDSVAGENPDLGASGYGLEASWHVVQGGDLCGTHRSCLSRMEGLVNRRLPSCLLIPQ